MKPWEMTYSSDTTTTEQPKPWEMQYSTSLEQEQPKQPGILDQVGKRMEGRLNRYWNEPTIAGEAVEKTLGTSFPAKVVKYAAEQPERMWRGASGIAGTIAEPVNLLGDLALKGIVKGNVAQGKLINKALGGIPSKSVKSALSLIPEGAKQLPAKAISGVSKTYEQLPESVKANIETLPDALEGVGFATGGGKSAKIIEGKLRSIATKKAIKELPGKIDNAIEQGIKQGVKPTVIEKKTLGRQNQFYDNAKDAVKNIVDDMDNINILDADGNRVLLPKSNAEFAQAIDQAKNNIYRKYHAMAMQAGDKGARFDVTPVVNQIADMSTDINLSLDARRYAENLFNEIVELDGATPDIIENRIKDLNSSLSSFYSGTRVDKAKSMIDAKIAGKLREQLDNMITNATDPGYKELKRQYGALKSIEQDVNKRAIVQARKASKGIADLTDIFTVPEMVTGLLTANPALIAKGAAGQGIKALYKSLNDPDRAIKKMFEFVSKSKNKLGTLGMKIK